MNPTDEVSGMPIQQVIALPYEPPFSEQVKGRVRRFQVDNGAGAEREEDLFAPYWLSHRHKVSASIAQAQSSNAAGDRGLDAFFLERRDGEAAVLWLYQAKYSSSRDAVRKGLQDLTRLMPVIADLLGGKELENGSANPILARLRLELQKYPELIATTEVQCVVLHLCGDDPELITEYVDTARRAFAEKVSDMFPPSRVVNEPELIGPATILGTKTSLTKVSSSHAVQFDGAETNRIDGTRYFAGLSRLSDLVTMYEDLRDALFERNVRYYLYNQKDKGPASYMRATLREICDRRKSQPLPPETFAMFHNGVTIHARAAEQQDGKLILKEPNILNGCQTVKNAYFFANDSSFAPHLDAERWAQVSLPLRVLVTTDEALIRQVAVSNNRQTAIPPHALYANDPLQVKLGQRFEQSGIFYERQEGAFKNLRNSDDGMFDERYGNSPDAPLKMLELAQAIATAAPRPALSVAARVSSLFEEKQYHQVFAEGRLERLELLVFLRNTLRWLPLALGDLRDSSDTAKIRYAELPLGRFNYPVARGLTRWIVVNRPAEIATWGRVVIGSSRRTAKFREFLGKMLSGHHSGIAMLVSQIWGDGQGSWRNPLDADLSNEMLRKIGVDRVDVFAANWW